MQIISAYIDASSISMIVAAVAGVAVTVGAVVAVYFRRAKKSVKTKLGIKDETDKNKEEDVKGSFDD